MKGHYTHAHETDFFRRYGPDKRNREKHGVHKPQKRRTSSTVQLMDRQARVHIIGGWRFSVGTFGGGFSVSVIAGKTHATSLVTLFVHGRQEELTDCP